MTNKAKITQHGPKLTAISRVIDEQGYLTEEQHQEILKRIKDAPILSPEESVLEAFRAVAKKKCGQS